MNPVDSTPYHVERTTPLYTKGDRRYTQAKISEVLEAASDICVDLGLPQDAVRLLAFSHMVAAAEMMKEIKEAKERAKKIDEGPTASDYGFPRKFEPMESSAFDGDGDAG
jgi:hypothetical protein